jgi:hypothetical protein
VVETNISYPADSQLLADGVRVLTRCGQRIEKVTGVIGRRVRNRKRATTRRVLEISRIVRSRDFKGLHARLKAGYRRLLGLISGDDARWRASSTGARERSAVCGNQARTQAGGT